MSSMEGYMKISEVAGKLGVSTTTIHRLIAAGRLKSIKLYGVPRMIAIDSLNRLLDTDVRKSD